MNDREIKTKKKSALPRYAGRYNPASSIVGLFEKTQQVQATCRVWLSLFDFHRLIASLKPQKYYQLR
jgi:hypothetical protein